MAFRPYANNFKIGNPSNVMNVPKAPIAKTRGFMSLPTQDEQPSEDNGMIHLGGGPSLKDQLTTAKDLQELQKSKVDMTKEKEAQMHNDMVHRAVFGHTQDELNSVLNSSTTGYQDPGANKFMEHPFAIEEEKAKAIAEAKPEKTDKSDRTAEVLAKLRTFTPGKVTDKMGMPIEDPEDAFNEAMRQSAGGRHYNPDDPQFDQVKQSFMDYVPPAPPAKAPEGPGVWDSIKSGAQSVINSTKSLIPGSNVPAPNNSPGAVDHASALEWAKANPNDPRSAAITQKAQQALGQ